jgi:hypothetical protein
MKLVGPDWAVHQLIPGRSRRAGVTGLLHVLTEVCTKRGLPAISKYGSEGESISIFDLSWDIEFYKGLL